MAIQHPRKCRIFQVQYAVNSSPATDFCSYSLLRLKGFSSYFSSDWLLQVSSRLLKNSSNCNFSLELQLLLQIATSQSCNFLKIGVPSPVVRHTFLYTVTCTTIRISPQTSALSTRSIYWRKQDLCKRLLKIRTFALSTHRVDCSWEIALHSGIFQLLSISFGLAPSVSPSASSLFQFDSKKQKRRPTECVEVEVRQVDENLEHRKLQSCNWKNQKISRKLGLISLIEFPPVPLWRSPVGSSVGSPVGSPVGSALLIPWKFSNLLRTIRNWSYINC